MGIDEDADIEKLERLAISFARDFLKYTKNYPQRVISLHGYDQNVLISIKNAMEGYFKENGREIPVELGKEGYQINVGRFLH